MKQASKETVVEDIKALLSESDPDARLTMIEELKSVLQRELMRTNFDPSGDVCPSCGCDECVRYGKTRAGTQRWQCKSCGAVRCRMDTGSILANTKLDPEVWMNFAECFVDRLSCDDTAERIGVCHKTAWFMRLRVMQGIFPLLPSFQVKAGMGTEVDELYFRESFKGTRFDRMPAKPREPRLDGACGKRGISSGQICVMTAFNDADDFFFDVCCRGSLSVEIAMGSLGDRICAGSVVNTDEHRAYPKVMRELKVAAHAATGSGDHSGLQRINEIHGDIRGFFGRFKGVSTRWLHLYLGWYKWLRCFGKSPNTAAKQISRGDYENTWRSLKGLGSPFRDAMMNPLKCRPRRPIHLFPSVRGRRPPRSHPRLASLTWSAPRPHSRSSSMRRPLGAGHAFL